MLKTAVHKDSQEY